MKKNYREIIEKKYAWNDKFFLRILSNYEQKYWNISDETRRKILELEFNKSKEDEPKKVNEIIDSLINYVKEIYIRIIDMTLREWDQAPWWWMNRFEKAIIALYLKEAWIDVIELWFAANPADYHNIKYILKHIWDWTWIDDPYLSTLCRANIWDVEKAIELFRDYNKPRIHVFYATSEKHMEAKVREKAKQQGLKKEEFIIQSFIIALEKALELKKIQSNFELEVSFEDAGNTKKENLLKLSKIMINKAKEHDTKIIINLPSTLWDKTSQEIADMFRYVYRWLLDYYKDYTNWELSTHNHNDNAEALWTSLEAIRSWATNVETSLLGLGEWAWNTQTHTFFNKINKDWEKLWIDFLEIYKNNKWKINILWATSRLFEKMFWVNLNSITPYIWEYVHINSSWIHWANWEVYRTENSIDNYGAQKPKEFFSSRWWTNQIAKILKNYNIDFENDTDIFKKIYILRIQREAEIVTTLYPATLYAIYQELKWNFSINEIITEWDKLKVSLNIYGKEIKFVWDMKNENWHITWIMKAISNYLWSDTKFDLTKVPTNKAIIPYRKVINDFRKSWNYLEGLSIDTELDKVIIESEKFEILKDFYYKIYMLHMVLDSYNSLTKQEKITEKWICFLKDISEEDDSKINKYIEDFENLKNFLEEMIYQNRIEIESFKEIKSKYATIFDKFGLNNEYEESRKNLENYLNDENTFNNMFGQTWVVYIEAELNWKNINSQAVSKSLTNATIKAIIFSALKEIEKKAENSDIF